jgi:hypothetical protein
MKTAMLILAIEIFLPGGTLVALAFLWLRRVQGGNKRQRMPVMVAG